jgi:hypothetical protein
MGEGGFMMELLIKVLMTECLIALFIVLICNKFEFDDLPIGFAILTMLFLIVDALAVLITLILMIWSW